MYQKVLKRTNPHCLSIDLQAILYAVSMLPSNPLNTYRGIETLLTNKGSRYLWLKRLMVAWVETIVTGNRLLSACLSGAVWVFAWTDTFFSLVFLVARARPESNQPWC